MHLLVHLYNISHASNLKITNLSFSFTVHLSFPPLLLCQWQIHVVVYDSKYNLFSQNVQKYKHTQYQLDYNDYYKHPLTNFCEKKKSVLQSTKYLGTILTVVCHDWVERLATVVRASQFCSRKGMMSRWKLNIAFPRSLPDECCKLAKAVMHMSRSSEKHQGKM